MALLSLLHQDWWLLELRLYASGSFLSENEREGLGLGMLYYY